MKPIRWMRSSQTDLKKFPADVRGEIGHGLYLVQCGERPNNEKPLHEDLSGVSELAADSDADSNTYRAVFTVKLEPFLYVLHCFQKKSKKGIATPKKELDVVRKRLAEAREEHRQYEKDRKHKSR